ncbi:MAG: hypothetical protein U9N04_05055 [Patescibacteria group bacterium]|nr:hypothetical protein [Patescibacteria group bacterium]
MKNIKIKKIVVFLISGFLVIFITIFTFDIATRLFNIDVGYNRIGNFFLVGRGTVFDLLEEPTFDPDNCKVIPWGGCWIEDIFYDKKHIQKAEDKYNGNGCNITVTHRFKAIKRGYTEINVDGTCHYDDMKYRILIF